MIARPLALGRAALMILTTVACTAATAAAQAPNGMGDVRTDPIRCWWKTDKASVHVGERFTLTLTCATIDTPRVRVAIDMGELDPAAVQLTPFEVVDGARREDLVEMPWRYSQQQYTLRILGDEFFGRDIDLPAFTVPYTVQVTSGRETQEGREQTYILPAIPIRVASLLPATATDIRDASRDSFATIENRRLRTTAALVAAGISFAFALAFLAMAAFQIWRVGRRREARPAGILGPLAILDGCSRELARLRADAASGAWSGELAERALAVLRIASAVGLSHPVAQFPVNGSADRRTGELLLRGGRFRRRSTLLSARVTADMISRRLAEDTGRPMERRAHDALRTLGESLRVFSAMRYGRATESDSPPLQRALDEAADAVRDLRIGGSWSMRVRRKLARAAALLGGAA